MLWANFTHLVYTVGTSRGGVSIILFYLVGHFISALMGQTVNESLNFFLEAIRENEVDLGLIHRS